MQPGMASPRCGEILGTGFAPASYRESVAHGWSATPPAVPCVAAQDQIFDPYYPQPDLQKLLVSQQAQIRHQQTKLREQHEVMWNQIVQLRRQEEQLEVQDQELRDKDAITQVDRVLRQEEKLKYHEDVVRQQAETSRQQDAQFKSELSRLEGLLQQQAEKIGQQNSEIAVQREELLRRNQELESMVSWEALQPNLRSYVAELGQPPPDLVQVRPNVPPITPPNQLAQVTAAIGAPATMPVSAPAPPVLIDPAAMQNSDLFTRPKLHLPKAELRSPPSLAELQSRLRASPSENLRQPDPLMKPVLHKPSFPVVARQPPIGLLQTPFRAPPPPQSATGGHGPTDNAHRTDCGLHAAACPGLDTDVSANVICNSI